MAPGAIHCLLLGIIFVSSFYVSPIKVSLSSTQVLSPSLVPRFLCPPHKACHHSYEFDTGSYDRCLIPSGPYRTSSRTIFPLPHALWAMSDFMAFLRYLMPPGPHRTLSRDNFPLPHTLWVISDFIAFVRYLMPSELYRTLSREGFPLPYTCWAVSDFVV
jgi:hypothetical protein